MQIFTTGMTQDQKIQAWSENVKELAKLKKCESEQRKVLLGELFPEPEKNTEHFDLGAGYKMTATFGSTITIDATSLELILPELNDVTKAAIKWEPKFVKAVYDTLIDGENKDLLDEALVSKPKSSTLKLVAPKVKADK